MSREMFRLWAPQQRRRYERLEGVPIEMAAERIGHVRVKARVWQALDRAIRDAGLDCEALGDGVTIEVDENTDYEPDCVVNCGPRMNLDDIAATNPVIVVEVLSPSTQSIDVSEKLADYFRVPSIQHYLIVRTRRQEVIHHRRTGDRIETRIALTGEITLDPPGIALSLADIYAD
jgi:Uma2 family endonuclease